LLERALNVMVWAVVVAAAVMVMFATVLPLVRPAGMAVPPLIVTLPLFGSAALVFTGCSDKVTTSVSTAVPVALNAAVTPVVLLRVHVAAMPFSVAVHDAPTTPKFVRQLLLTENSRFLLPFGKSPGRPSAIVMETLEKAGAVPSWAFSALIDKGFGLELAVAAANAEVLSEQRRNARKTQSARSEDGAGRAVRRQRRAVSRVDCDAGTG